MGIDPIEDAEDGLMLGQDHFEALLSSESGYLADLAGEVPEVSTLRRYETAAMSGIGQLVAIGTFPLSSSDTPRLTSIHTQNETPTTYTTSPHSPTRSPRLPFPRSSSIPVPLPSSKSSQEPPTSSSSPPPPSYRTVTIDSHSVGLTARSLVQLLHCP